MKLFRKDGDKLSRIKTQEFPREKPIQSLIEANTQELFGLEFVRSEFAIEGRRFDTLCYDAESNCFVVIEYKKGKDYSVIDQGYTYLSIMLNNKAEVLLEYNETLGKQVRRDDIDWSQSRIIFISQRFTEFQKMSVNFKNLPFELWEVQGYEGGLVGLTPISTDSDVDINAIAPMTGQNDVVKRVSKEVIRHTEEDHYKGSKTRPQWVIELYEELRSRVLALDSQIEIKVKKTTIGFHLGASICDIIFWDGGLGIIINLRKGELVDHLGLVEDVSEKGHWGNGDYKYTLRSEEYLEYAVSLIKQSYQKKGA